jgi:thiamine-phosphate pyrophosphorylase
VVVPSLTEQQAVRTGAARRAQLAAVRLYLCTDARDDRADLADFLDIALAGGVDVVQLRHKGIEARPELDRLAVFAAAAARHRRLLCVNDRADVANAARPDILHLCQDDLDNPDAADPGAAAASFAARLAAASRSLEM